MTLRFAVPGAGRIGQLRARAIDGTEAATLQAVAEVLAVRP